VSYAKFLLAGDTICHTNYSLCAVLVTTYWSDNDLFRIQR